MILRLWVEGLRYWRSGQGILIVGVSEHNGGNVSELVLFE